MAINKSDATEVEKEFGSQIQIIIGRVPKKNHDAALQIYKQTSDLFRKYGLLRSKLFQLNSTETYDDMGLTNIANTLSTKQHVEVWVELQYYRDRKHLYEVRAKCGNDENMGRLYKQSLYYYYYLPQDPGSSLGNLSA
jgi:hypothetical protein